MTSGAWSSLGTTIMPLSISGGMSCTLSSYAVTTPKFAPAPKSPQQVGVLVLAGTHQASLGGDHVGGDQVVAGQAVERGQPAVAAAEAEAADAGGGDPAAGRGHTV